MRSKELSPRSKYIEALSTSQIDEEFAARLQMAKLASDRFDKSGISLSASEGHLLSRFIQQHGCKTFLEIGTLTGYSALWILRGLGELGRLITLEKDPAHAQAAFEVLAPEVSAKTCEIIVGDARESLKSIALQFDGIFIDGNKAAYLDYLLWAESHVRLGGLIISDNVFLSGAVWGEQDTPFSEKQVRVMSEFNQRLFDRTKYSSYLVPTDEGMLISVKNF